MRSRGYLERRLIPSISKGVQAGEHESAA